MKRSTSRPAARARSSAGLIVSAHRLLLAASISVTIRLASLLAFGCPVGSNSAGGLAARSRRSCATRASTSSAWRRPSRCSAFAVATSASSRSSRLACGHFGHCSSSVSSFAGSATGYWSMPRLRGARHARGRCARGQARLRGCSWGSGLVGVHGRFPPPARTQASRSVARASNALPVLDHSTGSGLRYAKRRRGSAARRGTPRWPRPRAASHRRRCRWRSSTRPAGGRLARRAARPRDERALRPARQGTPAPAGRRSPQPPRWTRGTVD